MAGGGTVGSNTNPNKIKGGRWTVAKFFSISVRLASYANTLALLTIFAKQQVHCFAACFYYGVDDHNLSTGLLQDSVWSSSAVANEYCILSPQHSSTWLVKPI